MRAIRVQTPGGREALQIEDVDLPRPGPGEARVRVAFSGINFIDVYHRTGLYPLQTPFTPGSEGAGVVDAVGSDVTEVREGQRVAFAMHMGSYAEAVVLPAWKLVPVPEGVNLETAAAVMLQGMTAHYLTHSTFPIDNGHTALIHAAAGGVGLLLVQMAKRRGARIVGTVGTDDKARLAQEAGADEVVVYTRDDFREAARRMTQGEGVHVAYDSVGKATWEGSLESLRRRGMLVLFGNASGAVPPIDPLRLARAGSLFLTRPVLADYAATRSELLSRAGDLFEWIARDKLDVRIDRVLPLSEAAEAHRLLESRDTAGKLLLNVGE